jgi:CRP-like cAMP-binding protein
VDVSNAGATVFAGIDISAFASSSDAAQGIDFHAGDIIYAEGDDSDRVYFIVAGRVRVGCHAPDGRECLFAVLGPSEILGEESTLDPGPRESCATAATDVRAIALERRAVLALATADPQITERLLRVMARRIRWTHSNITDAAYADVPARVARQLLGLAHRFGVQEGEAVRVPMDLTREQFAHLVGSSRESVNKALCAFIARGWIRTDRDSIVIYDSQPLTSRLREDRSRRH